LAKQHSREKAVMKTKRLHHQTPIGEIADLLSGIANRYCEDNVGGSHSPAGAQTEKS
jgi:hypothetical protein